MEVTTQYSSASARTMPPDTLADEAPAANEPRAQPKVFPEALGSSQFAAKPNDGLSKRDPEPIGRTPPYVGAGLSHPNNTLPMEEHGGAPDACAKSGFRECRGGEALEANSSSYVQFDQFDHKETRGNDGRGTCEGILREALRRVDRNYGGETSNLRSVVIDMRGEMSSGRSDRTNIYGRIQAFQSKPDSLALSNYRESSDADLNPYGRTSHVDAVDGLVDSVSFMRRGGLAYINAGIRSADATGPDTSGHALLLQHLPAPDTRTGSDQYTIFDPNNGAFTYDSLEKMQGALRDYMNSAYTEDGNVATPNKIQFFSPPNAPGWGSLPPTTSVPGSVGTNTLEPTELEHHRYLGSDRSQANADNKYPSVDETAAAIREKRGGVLGSCGKSEFRECRGGEALKDGAGIIVLFDQNNRRETRGDDGRGTCEGIVREAMRRIDRSYVARSAIDLTQAVLTMRSDMRTSSTARESGIFDNIDTYQHNRNVLALRIYGQSRDLNFNTQGPSSPEDRRNSLIDGLNSMPPGGLAFVGLRIQTPGATSQEDNGHAILIQRNHDVPHPDGTPPGHRYIIFDPNNGTFEYETRGAMNAALRNYMDSAYTEIHATVTPDRAIFYVPRRLERENPVLPEPTLVPPSLQLPEPPTLMQPFPQGNHGAGASEDPHSDL